MKQNHYEINNPEAEIQNNTFINNNATTNSSSIYIERFNSIMIRDNTFRLNTA